MPNNVCRIEGVRLLTGVEVTPPIGPAGRPNYYRRLETKNGCESFDWLLGVPLQPERNPTLDRNLLIEASPLFRPGRRPTLVERGEWDGVIVEVDPTKLDFSKVPLFADDLSWWAGGQWHDHTPMLRVGDRSTVNKIEVWPLKAGSTLLVCDGQGKLLQLSAAMGGSCGLYPVTPRGLATYLLSRSKAATDVRVAEWAYRNLERLAVTRKERFGMIIEARTKYASLRNSTRQAG